MALGALISAYQEDDAGSLRALYSLAGRSLLEYQVRSAAAAGAAPVVVLVERLPTEMNDALERLRGEGLPVVAVSDGVEAASRFEAGSLILMIADGLAPDFGLLAKLAEHAEPVVALVPDDENHQAFERVDATSRWAGAALVDSHLLGSTAAMLGDWDLQSTLLRRAVQEGAKRLAAGDPGAGALLVEKAEDLAHFERRLIVATRGTRDDWSSRYVLPVIEEFATEKLMESRATPKLLVGIGLALVVGAIFGFTRGWIWQSYLALVLSTPFDLVAARLAALRLRPLASSMVMRRLLWPASGLALIALGWWSFRHDGEWGALAVAVGACTFAQAAAIERSATELPHDTWLFSRRNAIFLAAPFVITGWINALMVVLAIYAASSLFYAQHLRHRIIRD